jgi:putative ABC transport system permease protein
VQQAWLNFSAAKLRSCLAMLGILVGTAAIVALISAGKIATQTALAQFKSMGTDLLAITTYQQHDKATVTTQDKTTLSLATWRHFPALIPSIRDIAPYTTAYQTMSYQGHAITGPIIGADEALARIIHVELAQGYFVSSFESFEHHCVIGNQLADKLQQFSFGNPIGRHLQIGHVLYTIIGIAKPWKENAFFNEDINQAIIIPLASMGLINQNNPVNNAILLLNPSEPVDPIIHLVKQTIAKQAPKIGVFIRSAKQIISSMEKQGHIFTLLLTAIGGISLLVGGIGIMNVMLVAVSERKQEIGIRKAIGATHVQIQRLFLLESTLLSVCGGILGIFVGLIVTWIIATFNHWPFSLYMLPLLIGFGVSVITGIFFGFYPAYRAAKLDPIVSLRGMNA